MQSLNFYDIPQLFPSAEIIPFFEHNNFVILPTDESVSFYSL
jgi:hypothetical protein